MHNGLEQALRNKTIWLIQAKALGISLCYVVIASLLVTHLVEFLMTLRAEQEDESQGLDFSEHGEEGYTMSG
jgi:Amt family ammonium transporter